jgi:lathosterol oxidase
MESVRSILPWHDPSRSALLIFALFLLYYSALMLTLLPPFFLWATHAPKAFKRRVYALVNKPDQIGVEIRSGLMNMAIDSVLMTAMLKSGLARMGDGHVLATAVFSAIWFEVWFYIAHRALHTRALNFIHRTHHHSQMVNPLTGMSFSVLERSILVIGLGLGLWAFSAVYPISYDGVGIWYVFNYLFAMIAHCNIEFVSPRVNRYIGKLFNAPTYHALHHARHKGHYGLFMPFMDRWFGTEFDDYAEVHKSAYTGQAMTSAAQRCDLGSMLVFQLRSGRRVLADMAVPNALRPMATFEHPAVQKWLNLELRRLPYVSDKAAIWACPAAAKEWYLLKSGRIHGPFSLNDLGGLKGQSVLRAGDVCFSLSRRLAVAIPVLPEAEAVQSPGLFVNRRQTRTKMQVAVQITKGSANLDAVSIDISADSMAVFVLGNPDLMPGDELTIVLEDQPPRRASVQFLNRIDGGVKAVLLLPERKRRLSAAA